MKFDLVANTVYLRLVKEKDAEFICNLRNTEELNTYISKSTVDTKMQRQWIIDYKERETEGKEYYFIICRKSDDLPIGTVRLYDFLNNHKSFCWGSWILNADKPRYAAVESALLVYEAGFNHLNFDQSHFEVMKGNNNEHEFHLRMGAEKVREDEVNEYYIYKKETYEKNLSKYEKFLNNPQS